jgi:hypothetical protein
MIQLRGKTCEGGDKTKSWCGSWRNSCHGKGVVDIYRLLMWMKGANVRLRDVRVNADRLPRTRLVVLG